MSDRTVSLEEYRERLEGVETVRRELVEEILDVAEAEIEAAHGEFTISQAVAISGNSRSWFERRLDRWAEQGLARKPGRDWLLKAAVIPRKPGKRGFDPRLPADEIARRLVG